MFSTFYRRATLTFRPLEISFLTKPKSSFDTKMELVRVFSSEPVELRIRLHQRPVPPPLRLQEERLGARAVASARFEEEAVALGTGIGIK